MHSAALLTAITLLASSTSARIVGIAAPRTVAVDSTVKLEIIGEDYIQSIQDVAIAFGIQHGTNPTPDSLGTLLSSKYLGPGKHITLEVDKNNLSLTSAMSCRRQQRRRQYHGICAYPFWDSKGQDDAHGSTVFPDWRPL